MPPNNQIAASDGRHVYKQNTPPAPLSFSQKTNAQDPGSKNGVFINQIYPLLFFGLNVATAFFHYKIGACGYISAHRRFVLYQIFQRHFTN